MASREDIFFSGGIYHIFNKTIDKKEIFSDHICNVFIDTFTYYRSVLSAKQRFSHLKDLSPELYKERWREIFFRKYFLVEIIAFCLLPNHFHLALRQLREGGIVRFMSNISNSITHFYNEQKERRGPIFLPQFKSKMVSTQEGLNYLTRYIHTNCYAHEVVTTYEEIFSYPFSSIGAYCSSKNNLQILTDKVMHSFGDKPESYKKFIINNAEKQKMHEVVKYTDKWMR